MAGSSSIGSPSLTHREISVVLLQFLLDVTIVRPDKSSCLFDQARMGQGLCLLGFLEQNIMGIFLLSRIVLITAASASMWSFTPAAYSQGAHNPSLEGQVEVDTWTIPAGSILTATDDVHVISQGDVLIAGELLGSVRSVGQPQLKGVDLRISSRTKIVVEGLVRAGVGGDAFAGTSDVMNCQLVGGSGGSIVLEAPLIVIDGRVIAGDGGLSGANARSPHGGEVVLRGVVRTTRPALTGNAEPLWEQRAQLRASGGHGVFGGDGGRFAGEPFPLPHAFDGRGGHGGSVAVHNFSPSLVPFASQGTDGGAIALVDGCADGTPGMSAANTLFGGAGVPGNAGQNGTASSPQGGNGSPGGAGGNVTGNDGGAGGAAPACCPLPSGKERGGTGGVGGAGQSAVGGVGGAGGRGGNAYFDTALQAYVAPGGDGGNGGSGGHASSGNGGNGGAGGKPLGYGGAGGAAGSAQAGVGGAGGLPGRGTPNGAPGSTGAPGASYPGASGTAGPQAPDC